MKPIPRFQEKRYAQLMQHDIEAHPGRYGIATIALVLAAAFAHGLPFGTASPLHIELRNSLHSPVFAVLTSILLLFFLRRLSVAAAIAVSTTLAFTVGILGELAQLFTYGSASFHDLMRDAFGIALGLCVGLIVSRRPVEIRSRRLKIFLIASALVGALIVTGPPARVIWVIANQLHAFPKIAAFDNRWEANILSLSRGATVVLGPAPTSWGNEHGDAAFVTFSETKYSGFEIHASPDWSGYEFFSFTAASADDRQYEVSLRIDDEEHNGKFQDRYYRTFFISPEKRKFRTRISEIRNSPDNRELDIARIRTVLFFVKNPESGGMIILDDVRLEDE